MALDLRLSEDRIRRYSRQILLPEVGGRGQRALLAARVALHAGHAFSEAAGTWLAAAGVGALELLGVDPALADRLAAVNPDCRVTRGGAGGPPSLVVGGPEDRAPAGVPLVWAIAGGGTARASSACPACLPAELRSVPAEPPGAAAAAIAGALAAVEALHRLLGLGAAARVLEFDDRAAAARDVTVTSDPGCPACAGRRP